MQFFSGINRALLKQHQDKLRFMIKVHFRSLVLFWWWGILAEHISGRQHIILTVFPLFILIAFKHYLQRGKAAFPPPCFLENRGLEGVWAPPWGVLEGSGRLLGGSWLQEASWAEVT